MTRRWTVSLLVLLAPLVGCAPNVCDYAQEWADRCDVTWTDADTDSCVSTYKTCTRREKEKLDAFWLCMDGQGFFECRDPSASESTTTAGEGGESPVAAELLACEQELVGVSIGCSSAIGLEGGTFANLGTETGDGATSTSP